MTPELRAACCGLVFKAAKFYEIPPAYITAHTRFTQADRARRWVMQQMLRKLHMKRYQVALAFGRDIRRVRKSVLGI